MRKLFILIASTAFLAGCTKKNPIVYENDTDFMEWINQQTIKNVPNAHSGFSASVVDSSHAYSLGFSKDLEKISATKLKEVQFSYWVLYKSEQTKASTVISIDFNGKNTLWDGRLVVVNGLNKWTQIIETFKIPDNIPLNNHLSLYVWNNSKEEFMIDDLKITVK